MRARNNPPLVIFGNPPSARVVSRDVVEIRYRHAEDGRLYKHTFKRGQVVLIANGKSARCVLKRKDGRAILREF